MNLNLMISGISGAFVGGLIYMALSNPVYTGGAGEGVGQYLLWFIGLATIASLLAAVYGCIANEKTASQ
jgi:hypothetical protein